MEPKSGWKTTEFWMNLIAVVIAYLMSTDVGSDETSIVGRGLIAGAAALAALGYTAARAFTKASAAKNGA